MTVLSNRRFVGLDNWTDPGDLPIGGLTVAKNVYIVGFDCLSRPGLNGLLTTPHAGKAIFFPETFVKPDGTEWVLYCVGVPGASSGGKIYEYQKGASTDTELKDANNGNASFNIAPASFRGIQGGQYFYFITGAAGSLYRTDLSSVNCAAVTGLNPPTGTPTFTLGNQSVDAISSITGWQVDTITAQSNVLPGRGLFGEFNTSTEYNPSSVITESFSDLVIGAANTVTSASNPLTLSCVNQSLVITGGSGFTNGTYTITSVTSAGVATLNSSPGTIASTGGAAHITGVWTVISTTNDLDFNTTSAGLNQLPAGYTGTWAMMDDPAEGLTSPLILNSLISNTQNETRHAQQFKFSMNYYTSDSSGKQGWTVILNAYSDLAGSTLIGVASQTFKPPFAGQVPLQYWQDILDFPNLGADILSYTFTVQGAATNTRNNGGQVSAISLAPISNQVAVIAGLPSGVQIQNNYSAMGKGPANNGRFGGVRILKAYASDQNWSIYNTISINLNTTGGLPLSTLVANGLQVVFCFRQYNAGSPGQPRYYTNPVTIDTTTGAASVDITAGIPSAVRAAFRYFEVLFISDMLTAPTAFSPLFTITSISSGGNLSVDSFGLGYSNVFYAYEEVNSESDATLVNVLRSAGSLYSTGLQPSLENATGIVTMPAFLNASADYVAWYRGGGTFTDGQLRLIATVPKNSDVSVGGDSLAVDQSNPYYSWNHTTRTLTDNTPDSFLNFASLLQFGRDQPPTGATSITFHQNRVWLGVNQSIWCSWSLVDNNQNGLYFTTVDLTTDPSASIKGAVFPLRAQDGDSIQAMLPIGGQLLVLKGRIAGIVYGYDPENFSLQTFMAGAKLGCVASGAAVICNDTAFFLGPDSVYDFNGDAPGRRSIPLEPLLHPRGFDGGATITPSVFAGSSMMYYDGRLHLLAPVAGGTQNSVDYVYDFRNNVWTSWSIGMTSGASLAGSTDGDLAYMGGYDGQLYTFAAGGDKSTPGATTAAIPWQIVSRGMGQESDAFAPQSGIAFNSLNKVSRIFFAGTFPANTPLVASVWADANQSQWDTSYTSPATAGPSTIEVPTPGGTVGQQIFVSLSGSSVSQSKIRYLGADVERKAATR